MFCPNCGGENSEGVKFCQHCGSSMPVPPGGSGSYQAQPAHYTTQGVAAPVYAGFFQRFAALIIDGILLSIVYGLISVVFSSSLSNLLGFIAGAFYFIALESSPQQATLGKSLMRIKVTDLYGQRLSTSQAAVRYFSKILSALILYIGFIMAAFTERKQGLHDILAKTLVVKQ